MAVTGDDAAFVDDVIVGSGSGHVRADGRATDGHLDSAVQARPLRRYIRPLRRRRASRPKDHHDLSPGPGPSSACPHTQTRVLAEKQFWHSPATGRFSVGYDGQATRNRLALLVGSIIRANTTSRNTSSAPAAASKPSTASARHKATHRCAGRDDVIGNGSEPACAATPRSSSAWRWPTAARPPSTPPSRPHHEPNPGARWWRSVVRSTRSAPPSPSRRSSPCAHSPRTHPTGTRLVHTSAPGTHRNRTSTTYAMDEPAKR